MHKKNTKFNNYFKKILINIYIKKKKNNYKIKLININ